MIFPLCPTPIAACPLTAAGEDRRPMPTVTPRLPVDIIRPDEMPHHRNGVFNKKQDLKKPVFSIPLFPQTGMKRRIK
jgi:hypothetical protein